MEAYANLSREERLGLLVAGTAHVALMLAFVLHDKSVEPVPRTERITVSLATDVSLQSTAPDPSAEPAAALAPEIAPIPEPEVLQAPPPPPVPRPVQTQAPRPTPTPTATPTRRATPTPTPTATQAPRPTPTPTARPTPAPTATPTRATGSRVNENFMQGMSDSTGDRGSPGEVASPAVRSSIVSAINRQLKPHWNPPSGVGVDQLVTVVAFRLNRDGTVAGTPRALRTDGVNDNNRAQVARHQEQAVRAVRLAAPFNLPETYYSIWQDLEWNFDNRLAQ
ncbi:energy transducer TonB [Altererythrobacter sp. KTW20L]|uniref:energy transducer TonB n=1 Tax=Altererythrobacter sp. KTW20L TaxID=2942210 RepID=UPI0020BE3EDA|nr:energy transducer TonB [Altererythrobacter sp. KTW20L]MCL6250538.1 energy transducer TonB [Altererythrobacter sp. KTW20L]